jgi:hypothetical protein
MFFYDLGGQVLGHVGHAGAVVVQQLGADHRRYLSILLIDEDGASAASDQ